MTDSETVGRLSAILRGAGASPGIETDAELHQVADEQGVVGLLWDALQRTPGGGGGLLARLEPVVRAAAARDLLVARELRQVCEALDSAGVEALITKGAALAYTVYPQPWMRPRTDTDLLVRRHTVPAVTSALAGLGYVRSDAVSTGDLVSHQAAFERTDAHGVHHVLDVHWKIVNPQVLADALTFDDLRQGAVHVPALGMAARVPGAAGSLALACVHRLAHHHGHERLVWLYDMKLLAERFDTREWTMFRELVCTRRIAGLCLDGLRSARHELDAPLPPNVEEALDLAAPTEPSRAYLEGAVTKRDVLKSDLAALGSWRDRLQLLREHAFPPSAFMRQRYGARSRWVLPVLYVHRLVTGASKWVR